jgi:hypothetical protein
MSINIPDKIPKLFVSIGIILFSFGYYNAEQADKVYFDKVDKYNIVIDSLKIEQVKVNYELEELVRISKNLSNKYDVEDPISIKKATTSFNRILSGDKNKLIVSDSINKLWEMQSKHSFNLKLLDKKTDLLHAKLLDDKDIRNKYQNFQSNIIILGIIFFIIGLFGWMMDEPDIPIVKQSEKIYQFCQSCGKAFTAIRKYGLERDQTPNHAFCETCYNNGEFLNSTLTQNELISTSLEAIKSKNWLTKKLLKSRLKRLERWNPEKY